MDQGFIYLLRLHAHAFWISDFCLNLLLNRFLHLFYPGFYSVNQNLSNFLCDCVISLFSNYLIQVGYDLFQIELVTGYNVVLHKCTFNLMGIQFWEWYSTCEICWKLRGLRRKCIRSKGLRIFYLLRWAKMRFEARHTYVIITFFTYCVFYARS
jgi:hypothetical protein